jgi:hypothetical protein
MNYAITLTNHLSSEHIYIGWKTLSHVFNRVTAKHPDNLKKIYEVSRNAYLIYLEYIDQMTSAVQLNASNLFSSFNYNSAVIFVYNKLSDELPASGSLTYDGHKTLFYQMITITGMVFSWNQRDLSIIDRRSLIEKNLDKMLHAFCNDDKFKTIEAAAAAVLEKKRDIDEINRFLRDLS